MTKREFFAFFDNVVSDCLELLKKKNSDYSGNNLDFLHNFKNGIHSVSPSNAVMVRLSDKINRLSNLMKDYCVIECPDEKIEDTIKDAINYLIILLALEKEKSDEVVSDTTQLTTSSMKGMIDFMKDFNSELPKEVHVYYHTSQTDAE